MTNTNRRISDLMAHIERAAAEKRQRLVPGARVRVRLDGECETLTSNFVNGVYTGVVEHPRCVDGATGTIAPTPQHYLDKDGGAMASHPYYVVLDLPTPYDEDGTVDDELFSASELDLI